MKKFYKKIAFLLSLLMVCSVAAGCEKSVDLSGAPDYSGYSGEFITYGYSGPTDGTWWRDAEQFSSGEDFRTVERYSEYKAAGLNTLLVQANEAYHGEDFATSNLKRTMDRAYEGGIKRIIVYDSRLAVLSESRTQLIRSDNYYGDSVNESAPYATYQELLNYVRNCIDSYKDHPAFFGVMLVDEPFYDQLPQSALMYRVCEESLEGIYVQLNLLPLDTSSAASNGRFQDPNGEFSLAKGYNVFMQYELYLRQFCEWSGCDRICVDSYPIRQNTRGGTASSYYILDTHLRNLRIMNKVAKEFGCSLDAVSQTMGLGTLSGDSVHLKPPNRSEMYWQMNAYMGFGIKAFASFTYWAKQQNSTKEEFYDGSAYMTHDGEKTDLYYTMQKIHAEMQEFAPVLLNFEYQGMRYYYTKPTSHSTLHLSSALGEDEEMETFVALKDVEYETAQMALATELKDKQNGNYLYMLMNPQAPSNAKFSDVSLTATMDFGDAYKAVQVWYKGKRELIPLKNGKITFELAAGYAVYVMPY